jgi:hypothetical protein
MVEIEELEDIKLYDDSKNNPEPAVNKDQAMIVLATERK